MTTRKKLTLGTLLFTFFWLAVFGFGLHMLGGDKDKYRLDHMRAGHCNCAHEVRD